MSYYPPALPEPQLGNAFTTKENRLTTEGDIAPRTRILDANHRQTLSLTFILTEAEFRVFESWFRHRLFDGVAWFDMNWGGRAGRAHFTSEVTAQLSGIQWQISTEAQIDYSVSGGY